MMEYITNGDKNFQAEGALIVFSGSHSQAKKINNKSFAFM
jgi:hypothetical protein